MLHRVTLRIPEETLAAIQPKLLEDFFPSVSGRGISHYILCLIHADLGLPEPEVISPRGDSRSRRVHSNNGYGAAECGNRSYKLTGDMSEVTCKVCKSMLSAGQL